jgi:sterol desaturase/sphingolipid hydroxylase (fatty acid hydroxylase superfamily)
MEQLAIWLTTELPERALAGMRFEAIRYSIGTLGVFFGVNTLLAPFIRRRKIRRAKPPRSQIWMELSNSFCTICVFVALDIAIFDLARVGVLRKYDDVAQYGWAWFWLSVPAALILHDAYFYWAHRAMHHPKIYKWCHLAHHRSHNPTPFTAYSFAPAEAAVQYLFVPLMLVFLPVHGTALAIILLVMIFKNATGHCGYELFPGGMLRNPFLRQLTTVTHHDMHHERANGNYGFYFTWWDKWMGTEHRDYAARFEQASGGNLATLDEAVARSK